MAKSGKLLLGLAAQRTLQYQRDDPFPTSTFHSLFSHPNLVLHIIHTEEAQVGYIKHFDGRHKYGTLHVGWVDAKTGEPVDDKDIRGRYEKEIMNHAGVRFIATSTPEPGLFCGYDPKHKIFNSEVELIHDLEPLEGGQWLVKLKKGARVYIPKAISYNRLVAGQPPTGWNTTRYGIPEDIIARTDRFSLWSLVATADSEALDHAGTITDPYELYQHIHPSETVRGPVRARATPILPGPGPGPQGRSALQLALALGGPADAGPGPTRGRPGADPALPTKMRQKCSMKLKCTLKGT
ncbi:hypothetical protein BGW80DRAFT_1535351 [Lactifluus volemus]|nr:hypothetical protein BGW80DRAFT_1535351 [Lactifluus volemus]